jgi:hypothetical protein
MMVNDLALLIRKNNLNFSEVVLPENIKVKIKETLDA